MEMYLGPILAWRHETQSCQLVQLRLRVLFQELLPVQLTAVQINGIVALAQDVGDLVLVFVSAINEVRKLPLQSIQKPFCS